MNNDTYALARELGIEPVDTPVCSPSSNGMAESFGNTFERGYVSLMDRSTAELLLDQLPDLYAFQRGASTLVVELESARMHSRQRSDACDKILV